MKDIGKVMRAQFVRGEDPKKSIGIGKNRSRDFKNGRVVDKQIGAGMKASFTNKLQPLLS